MKLIEIPLNTIVELIFHYQGERYKINLVLLYKYGNSIYISGLKNMGKSVPAAKLKNVVLMYRTDAGVYTYNEAVIRSTSYNGLNLYALESEQEAKRAIPKNAYKLFVGVNICAKIIQDGGSIYVNCILKDISMVGMGILSNKKIEKESKIEISFRVNEESTETLVGNIIQVYEFKNGKGFFYGCEFDEPNETIGKYIAGQKEKINNEN